MRQCIVPINCSWDEFAKSRGRRFRKHLRLIGRNLDRLGSCRTYFVDNLTNEVIDKILAVERRSWKEIWRKRAGERIDEDLLLVIHGSVACSQRDLRCRVWFLELNDNILAYTIILQFKRNAIVVKTSYDMRYEKLSPGIHVMNSAIRELFDSQVASEVDFLTDLPFMRRWGSISLPRMRVMMSRRGIVPVMFGIFLRYTLAGLFVLSAKGRQFVTNTER